MDADEFLIFCIRERRCVCGGEMVLNGDYAVCNRCGLRVVDAKVIFGGGEQKP